jgi:class 3 adenylate cyclase/tetratricopeptide (TPR) repeat protein
MTARVVERRIVTVLFADLVGFTALSEQLDAEDVSLVQDAYFEAVRETVERHGGLLEKFVGDAAMAVFGAPRVRDDDAERAVRAGLALVAAVGRLGAAVGLDEDALAVRVGVNTGEAVYGEATAQRGPVTGDTVNVAARLQASALPGSVLAGELTALAVADAAELERLEPLELKGKAEPVPVWRVVGLFPERSRERALGALRAPMVGREGELAGLLERLGREAGRVVVVAPPGVGKTRLTTECGEEALRRGAAVFRARLRPDLLSPFEPVGQLVRSVAAPSDVGSRLASAGLRPARAAVVADALAAVVAPVEAAHGVGEERDRLFAAWLEGLDALAAGSPALWLVEDLHWASGDLLAFLDLAGREPSPGGRLVVGTARPSLLETSAAWCGGAELLHLEPLPPTETAELVRALVGDVLPQALVERIADRSGGNALFVEELLRTWVTSGLLTPAREGAWALAADPEDVHLPATVQAIYAGQLDDLPGPARTAARRAAVAGRSFPAAALAPLGVDEPEEAVATLVRRALVCTAVADPTLGESHVYRHALLRDAGYASLAKAERSALHARFGDWLAGFPEDALPTLAEVIARHYAAAVEGAPALAREVDGRGTDELREEAASWFERAAEIASRFAAWESARSLGRRALELTAEDDPLSLARRRERLAAATANAAGVDEAGRLLREALEAYRAAGGPAARAGIASAGASLGGLLRAQTRFAEAERLATALLEEIGGPEDGAVARLLLLRSYAVLNAWDDYERAGVDAQRALALAREAGDAPLELEALQLTAQVASERGDDAGATWERVEELARGAGRHEAVAAAIRIRAFGHLDDEPERALPLADEAAEIAAAYGLVEAAGWADYQRAEALFAAGRWPEAIAAGLRAIELGEERGYQRVVVRSWFVLLPIARAQGRDDLVRLAFPRFDERARLRQESDSYYARIVATAAHLHFAALGLEPAFVPDLAERLPCFDMDQSGPSWLAAVEEVVGAWIGAGELAGAGEALDRMRARLDSRSSTRLARAAEASLRSRLLLARGDERGAAGEARRSLAELGDGAPWWRSRAIRLAERAGVVDPELGAEARSIEARLGVD